MSKTSLYPLYGIAFNKEVMKHCLNEVCRRLFVNYIEEGKINIITDGLYK